MENQSEDVKKGYRDDERKFEDIIIDGLVVIIIILILLLVVHP